MPIITLARQRKIPLSELQPEINFVIVTMTDGKVLAIRAVTDPQEIHALGKTRAFTVDGIGAVFVTTDDWWRATYFQSDALPQVVPAIGRALIKQGLPFGTRTMTMHLERERVD